MKITDLIVQNKTQVDEAPMGFLKTMGNKVASTFGSGQAQGRLDTGKIANSLKNEFDVYLGKTGQEPTGEMILGFLKSKGYPTAGAEKVLKAAPAPGILDKVGGAVKDIAGAAAAGAKTQMAKDAEPAQQPQQTPAAQAAQPVDPNADPAGRVDPTMDPEQPQAAPAAKPEPGAAAFGQMAKQLGAQGEKPATSPVQKPVAAQPAPAPAAQTPAAAPQASPTTAQQPQPGNKALGPKGRATLARLGTQKQKREQPKQGALDLNSRNPLGKSVFEQNLNFFRMLKEGLSAKQIDAMFLAAAQDKARMGDQSAAPSQGGAQAPAGAPATKAKPDKDQVVEFDGEQYKWLGAQWQNLKTGKVAEKGIVPQLNKLAGVGASAPAQGGQVAPGATPNGAQQQGEKPGATLSQPNGGAQQPGGDVSTGMDHIRAAYDGLRGASYGASDPDKGKVGKALKDTSGRVPQNIMSQLNKLSDGQRKQLRKELDKG